MVDFPGHLPFGLEYAVTTLVTDALPGSWVRTAEIGDAFDLVAHQLTEATNNEPVTIIHEAISGRFQHSFFDDFYNRIWLIPNVIDFGALSEDSESTFTLWNAWLVDVDISSLSLVGLDNVSIDGPSSAHTFEPLSATQYVVRALYLGNPSFDGYAALSFSSGEVRKVAITGVRAFLWDMPFWPNWRDPVKVSYEFRTEIITARSGLEQRRAMRQTPRKSIEFTATVANTPVKDALRQFRRFMDRGQNKTTVMPEFARRVGVAVAPSLGDGVISLPVVPSWIVADSLIILKDDTGSSLYRVQGITGASILLAQTLTRDWSANSVVIAGVSGRLPDALPSTDRASFVSEISVRFTGYPGQEPLESSDEGSPGMMFDGREVLTWRPDWSMDPTVEMQWPIEEIDAGFGVLEDFRIVLFPARVIKAKFWVKSAAESETVRQFFQRMRGKQGEFFVPSFENDIRLREPAPSGTNRMRLIGTEPFYTYNESLSHRAVVARMTDGTLHAFKIQTVFTVDDLLGEDTVLEFTSSLSDEIGGADTTSIDWLLLARFASDILSVQWETINFATIEPSFQTLVYSEAE